MSRLTLSQTRRPGTRVPVAFNCLKEEKYPAHAALCSAQRMCRTGTGVARVYVYA